jgi:lipopolysaccharide transport system permease protein
MRIYLFFLYPFKLFKNLWINKNLIIQLTKRDVASRYQGSFLGIMWAIVNPLLMLLVYTFVFSEIFKAKWSTGSDSKLEFALIIFCGLITFSIFSDLISRAPSLIINNVNYVKKVVFPLEILPIIVLGSTLIHVLISVFILTIILVVSMGVLNWTLIYLPLVLLPIILLSVGIAWFLASLGVFLRDIAQVVGVGVQALLLLSPIMYPITLVPEYLRHLYFLNPISYVVEDMRRIVIWGYPPNWLYLLIGFLISGIIFVSGHIWFQKTKHGFADVL